MIRRLLFGWQQAGILLITLVVLSLLARYHFLLFHTLVELLRVVVLGGVFVLAWHTRQWTNNSFLLVFGIAAIFIAPLELLHTLTYKDMGILHTNSANPPTQLWLAFRYMEALAFLLATLLLGHKVQVDRVFGGFALLAVLLGGAVFTGHFPDAFVEGQGLTPFKIYSEYLIILVFLGCIALVWLQRRHLEQDVRWLLMASLLFNTLSSAAFTRYGNVFDMANEAGHYFLLMSTYLIYRAILVTGLLTPYALLFRDLKKKEQELELQVAERTASLRETQALNTAFIANSPAMIAIKDLQGRYTLTNPAFKQLSDSVVRHLDQNRQEVFKSGQSRVLLEEISIGQQERFFETVHFPVRDAEGQLLGSGLIATDVTEQKSAAARVAFLAHYDSLTGLPNKTLFMEQMEAVLNASQQAGSLCALIYLDLDHFKDINDSLGHETGDALLCSLGERLQQLIAGRGLLCRFGGDEFLLLLHPIQDAAEVKAFVQRILSSIAEPFQIQGYDLFTTPSVGISMYPQDGQDFATLFRNADTAMYAVKSDGRNSHRFFEEQLQTQVQERLSLLSKLRGALERDELQVVYQPQYDATGQKVLGMEALLRWQHPELGSVSPARFIPLAEDSGLITQIGEWVLWQACQQAVDLQKSGFKPFVMAVNLSAVQFRHSDLYEIVRHVLKTTGLQPGYLELELTESLLLKDQERLMQTLQRLKSLGIQLAIDDFGTGYSNLSYLKRFAVNKLKVDQSFVRDMETDADSHALVLAIIQMAHSLGLQVIAEGVETQQQMDALKRLDCDAFQGYHLARPMPADQLLLHLQASN